MRIKKQEFKSRMARVNEGALIYEKVKYDDIENKSNDVNARAHCHEFHAKYERKY